MCLTDYLRSLTSSLSRASASTDPPLAVQRPEPPARCRCLLPSSRSRGRAAPGIPGPQPPDPCAADKPLAVVRAAVGQPAAGARPTGGQGDAGVGPGAAEGHRTRVPAGVPLRDERRAGAEAAPGGGRACVRTRVRCGKRLRASQPGGPAALEAEHRAENGLQQLQVTARCGLETDHALV